MATPVGGTMQQSQRPSFPEAFMRERARYQVSRAQIAQHVGVGVGVVKRWERGEAIPNIQQFKRLITRLPRVAPFGPDWGRFAEAALDGRLEEKKEDLARDIAVMQERGELEPKPPAQPFGDGLRRCREENEVTLDELGELLGITGQAIGQWECDGVTPVAINLQKLYDVLPELKAGVDTGAIKRPDSRDIPVPVGNRLPRASTVDTALQMALKQSDDERQQPLFVRPRHDPPAGPDLSKDFGGLFHEHRFDDEVSPSGVSTRVVCSICGAPKPSPKASIVRQPLKHSVEVRRCPCGGEVIAGPASDWICAKCRRELADDQLVEASARRVSTLGELAQDYAQSRLALIRARQASTNAAIALRDAEAALRMAEKAHEDALALLDLAAEES